MPSRIIYLTSQGFVRAKTSRSKDQSSNRHDPNKVNHHEKHKDLHKKPKLSDRHQKREEVYTAKRILPPVPSAPRHSAAHPRHCSNPHQSRNRNLHLSNEQKKKKTTRQPSNKTTPSPSPPPSSAPLHRQNNLAAHEKHGKPFIKGQVVSLQPFIIYYLKNPSKSNRAKSPRRQQQQRVENFKMGDGDDDDDDDNNNNAARQPHHQHHQHQHLPQVPKSSATNNNNNCKGKCCGSGNNARTIEIARSEREHAENIPAAAYYHYHLHLHLPPIESDNAIARLQQSVNRVGKFLSTIYDQFADQINGKKHLTRSTRQNLWLQRIAECEEDEDFWVTSLLSGGGQGGNNNSSNSNKRTKPSSSTMTQQDQHQSFRDIQQELYNRYEDFRKYAVVNGNDDTCTATSAAYFDREGHGNSNGDDTNSNSNSGSNGEGVGVGVYMQHMQNHMQEEQNYSPAEEREQHRIRDVNRLYHSVLDRFGEICQCIDEARYNYHVVPIALDELAIINKKLQTYIKTWGGGNHGKKNASMDNDHHHHHHSGGGGGGGVWIPRQEVWSSSLHAESRGDGAQNNNA